MMNILLELGVIFKNRPEDIVEAMTLLFQLDTAIKKKHNILNHLLSFYFNIP